MALKRLWMPSPNYSSRSGSPRLIVLHTAEGATTIESLGSWFSRTSVQASSHTGADDTPNTVGEYVKRDNKAWTQAAFNSASVSIELCAFASWSADEWKRHPQMLQNTADWIAEEAAHYNIPITRLTAAQAQGSGRGVCGHVDLGAGGGGHWDPGPNFPYDLVLRMALGGRGPEPTPPTPTPPKQEQRDMVASALAANGNLHVFRADGDTISYTWQKAGDSAWNGGKSGVSPAAFTQFAKAASKVTGITAELSKSGALNVFVDCDNGKTYYTWQRKGETSWNGGQAGKTVAGLALFA
jgi:N-acetylmuramoyl-L-alanine amidase